MRNTEHLDFGLNENKIDLQERNPERALNIKTSQLENIDTSWEFIAEWSERCEKFCELHPVAMDSFFKKFLTTEQV